MRTAAAHAFPCLPFPRRPAPQVLASIDVICDALPTVTAGANSGCLIPVSLTLLDMLARCFVASLVHISVPVSPLMVDAFRLVMVALCAMFLIVFGVMIALMT